nr:MAG TPA: hypothetical protein [Caudoviricetes sp.]
MLANLKQYLIFHRTTFVASYFIQLILNIL